MRRNRMHKHNFCIYGDKNGIFLRILRIFIKTIVFKNVLRSLLNGTLEHEDCGYGEREF